VEAGLAALRWIAAGHGCAITGLAVLAACSSTMDAARNCSGGDEIEGRAREVLAAPTSPARAFATKTPGRPPASQ
jgi:hypothetical protein